MLISDKYSKRDANFELLRILSMFMVLILHFLLNCGFLSLNSGNYFVDNVPWIIEGICYVAVDCFVLITGYFMYKSKFKLSKVFSLIIQIVFYSIVTYFFEVIFLKVPIDLKDVIYAFIPVISGKYWFISNYIFLLLISPFLNLLIKNLDKKSHFILCFVLIISFSFISTFFAYSGALKYEKSYDIVWFVVLYLVSAFIGKYGINISNKYKWILYICSTFCIFCSKIIFELLNKISVFKIIFSLFFNGNSKFGYEYSSLFVFLSAISLLLIFKDIRINNKNIKKIINFTGSLVLACYIIPDGHLWKLVNPFNHFENYALIILYSVVLIILIFTVCCFIELIRKEVFDFIYLNIKFERKCDDLQIKISESFSKLIVKL